MKWMIQGRKQWSQIFLAPGTGFVEDNFSMDQGMGWGDGFWMFQVYYIYRALYFYYDYISPTCDQALGPRGRGPLV